MMGILSRVKAKKMGANSLLFTLFISLFLWSCTGTGKGPGGTYYVDASNGSDKYNGASPTFEGADIGPWKTVARVNKTRFSPGDSILFKRGETWLGTPLQPKNGGEAGGVITISDEVLSEQIQFDLVDPENHNCVYFGAYGKGDKPKIDCQREKGLIISHNYIIVEDLHLDNGGNNMLLFDHSKGNYWNVVRRVEVTNCAGNAVRFSEGGGNCWLQELNVYDYKVNGIYLEGSEQHPLKGVLVEDCRVEDPEVYDKEDGISCHRDADGNNITGDIIIRNNTVIRSGEDGIDITSGTNILVEGNVLEHCHSGGVFVGKTWVNTVEVRGNFINANSISKTIGDLTIGASKVRAVNNIITGTGHHSICLNEGTDIQIWNNVIAPVNRTGHLVWLRGKGELRNVVFKNNIFDLSQAEQMISGSLDNIIFDNNCYYAPSKSRQIYSDLSFEGLRAANSAFEPNGFWANPRFVAKKKQTPDHFKLAGNSPCINRGEALPLAADFWKNDRLKTGKIDVGVFEKN